MGPEWIIPLIVLLVLFGGSQLPKLARGIGSAQREFKKGLHEHEELAPPPEEKITMTRAELDALLAERETKARKDGNPA